MTDTPATLVTRRKILRLAAAGVAACLPGAGFQRNVYGAPADYKQQIRKKVEETLFIDTHEHLLEEEERLTADSPRIRSNDWSYLISHYINSDLITAGMPQTRMDEFFSPEPDPIQKWDLLEPFWQSVRHTGYGQAVEITLRKLYDIPQLNREAIPKLQDAYLRTIKPGYYKTVLQEICKIDSCQVNYLAAPFSESKQPTLLMQDISILGMHIGPNIKAYAPATGIEVKDLSDWHRVIDWWFEQYGPYAVAVKSQAAYGRALDYEQLKAEEVAPAFARYLNGDALQPEERKRMEDHLFWYCVNKAAEYDLPVKIHTGYYAGHNSMPLSRVQTNAASVTDLSRAAPHVKWVFMHIGYPYYEDLIAAAKHYTNCHIDMCWAWILSPVASVNFLKQYLVTAPANKVFTFGGDYMPVEPVIGHAHLARQGIINTLCQLVEEDWLTMDDALNLVEPVMNGNARQTFHVEEKKKKLEHAPWLA
jgi:predicted TIM-barrel fold metal-dependent hydrolase